MTSCLKLTLVGWPRKYRPPGPGFDYKRSIIGFWKENHLDWYGVSKELKNMIHAKELMMLFRFTIVDVLGWVNKTWAIYLSMLKKNLLLLGALSS